MGVSGYSIENVSQEQDKHGEWKLIDSDKDPSVILLYYPSILEDSINYIPPRVKIEISCLSMDEPTEMRHISSLIGDSFDGEDADAESFVRTVVPTRTFLEKLFLLAEEFQKEKPRSVRMSRHLYDLEKLMDTEYGEEAFDWDELNDVSAIELRRAVNPVDLENAEHRFVRNVYNNVAGHINALKLRALIVADKVVAAEKLARKDKETRSNVRCRVRVTTSNTLEISWYKLHSFRISESAAVVTGKTYRKNVDGKQITYMVKGVHLKKGRLHKYPASKFKDEPLWARRLIEESEDINKEHNLKTVTGKGTVLLSDKGKNINIANNAKITIYTGNNIDNATIKKEFTGTDFKSKYVTNNEFDLRKFLIENDVPEDATINMQIYTVE